MELLNEKGLIKGWDALKVPVDWEKTHPDVNPIFNILKSFAIWDHCATFFCQDHTENWAVPVYWLAIIICRSAIFTLILPIVQAIIEIKLLGKFGGSNEDDRSNILTSKSRLIIRSYPRRCRTSIHTK
jgi:hypothetical protein